MAPLPTPRTPSDTIIHDIALSLRVLAHREDENEPGTVELREPVSGVDATPTAATSKGDRSNPAPKPEPSGAAFDPSDHTVDEVNAYLADADEAERQRVLDAEAAGKGRKTVQAPESD